MSGTPPGSAGKADPGPPDAVRLRATVERLASDAFTGRRVGTPGGEAAGAWLVQRLRDLGVHVTTSNFPVHNVRELRATPVLEWRNGTAIHRLTHRRDFAENLASADVSTPREARLATVDSPDWRDRWVLADSPGPETHGRAAAAGAAGLLVPRGVDADGWMPKMIVSGPAGELPVIGVRRDIHQAMSTTPGAVSACVPLRTVEAAGVNIHAAMGTGAASRILLTAHYDGVGDDPQRRLPAACDNASGVAVVLETIRLLATSIPDDIGVAVAFLDGEEAGARGSAHHARDVAPGTFVINVDGAARMGAAAVVEAAGPAETLLDALDRAGRATGVPLRPGVMASDNRRYAAAGLPAVGIGMGMPGYQTPAETPDRVDTDTLVAATRLVTGTVRRLSASFSRQPDSSSAQPGGQQASR